MLLGFFSRIIRKSDRDQAQRLKSSESPKLPAVTQAETRYYGQYSQSIDEQRPIEIFEDSVRIARSSKNPETAQSRYELALEAYRASKSFQVPADVGATLDQAYLALRQEFPTLKVINHAMGLISQAEQKKKQSTSLRYLQQAADALDKAFTQPGVDQEDLLQLRKLLEAKIARSQQDARG